MDDVVVRLATLDDAEAIRRIYNYEVEHTTHTFDLVPRTIEDQQAWLQERAGAWACSWPSSTGRWSASRR